VESDDPGDDHDELKKRSVHFEVLEKRRSVTLSKIVQNLLGGRFKKIKLASAPPFGRYLREPRLSDPAIRRVAFRQDAPRSQEEVVGSSSNARTPPCLNGNIREIPVTPGQQNPDSTGLELQVEHAYDVCLYNFRKTKIEKLNFAGPTSCSIHRVHTNWSSSKWP
jgi:hypothetical protein